MADYTISGNGNIDGVPSFVFIETEGDSISAGNMITSGTLEISPNEYYVIKASDFSIGDALPSSIQSVAFTDTTEPDAIDNKVTVTATFASDFVMPSGSYQSQRAV